MQADLGGRISKSRTEIKKEVVGLAKGLRAEMSGTNVQLVDLANIQGKLDIRFANMAADVANISGQVIDVRDQVAGIDLRRP